MTAPGGTGIPDGRTSSTPGPGQAGAPRIEWDPIARASYVNLAKGTVAHTIEVTDSLMLDIDEDGHPLGVEVLGDGDWRDALARLAMNGTLIVFRDTDGENSMRALTYGEIADALAAAAPAPAATGDDDAEQAKRKRLCPGESACQARGTWRMSGICCQARWYENEEAAAAPAPAAPACSVCRDTGLVDVGHCNCGSPADSSIGYAHEPLCGAEQCQCGAWDKLHPQEPQPQPAPELAAAMAALAKVAESHERVMYAALIDITHGDPNDAQLMLQEQLDGWDGPQWNGSETGTEWLERTDASAGQPERAASAQQDGTEGQ